jgi:tRNA (uracil-5-)-methyltransferase TRM9
MTSKIEIEYVKQIYQYIASEFNVTRAYKWSWITNFINSLPKNSLIYDIGCGSGRNMDYSDYRFIGFDNCESFIELCRNKGLKAYYSEITDIKIRDNSACALICIATFHHLSAYENRIKALQELKRIVKVNGKILLSVWAKEQPKKTRITFDKYGDNIVFWKKKYPRYYYIFELEEIKLLINEVGLNIDNEFYDCGNNVFILSKN